MDKPESIIPVRFEYKNAARELKKVEQGGQQIADTTTNRFQGAFHAAKGLGSEIRDLIRPRSGPGTVNQVAGTSSDQFQQTLDYIKGVSTEFSELQRTVHQVAALNWQGKTSELSLAEVQKLAASGPRQEGWQSTQEKSQVRAGIHLEGSQGGLSQQQLQTYQQQIAKFAEDRGIVPDQAMAIGDSLLRSSKGPQDVNQLLERYGKVFQTLERAPSPVSQLLPQLSRAVSQGFSPEGAAQALAFLSEAMPGEEGPGGEHTFKALTNAELQAKGPELAFQEAMTPSKYSTSAVGRSAQAPADLARRKTEQGYQFQAVEQPHLEGERRLIDGGRLTEPDWNPGTGEFMPGVGCSLWQGADFRSPPKVRGQFGGSITADSKTAALGTVAMTARFQELLERIAHSNEKMARQAEDRPLVAPPPNPRGRM